MATATLTANPTTVPAGGSSTVTVVFDVEPGKTVDVVLSDAGVEVARGTVAFLAEATPTVQIGSTGSGWEIRTTDGVLSSNGNNTFTLVA